MVFFLIVLAVLAAIVTAAIIGICCIPGAIADRRHHPRAAAIRYCGYAALPTLGISWLIGTVWACMGRRKRQ